jgi:ribonuclease HII
VCGIDEAGRGPLAGPVYAAAVILPDDFPVALLNDSKKLSPQKREAAAALIKEKAVCYGIGRASHDEIDAINILQATLLAMRRAFAEMAPYMAANLSTISTAVVNVIVDGNKTPDLSGILPVAPLVTAVVKADAKVHAVMAASILAKTERDAEMLRLSALYPQYRYEKHKGYPTREHAALVREFGPSPVQRLSFRVPYS